MLLFNSIYTNLIAINNITLNKCSSTSLNSSNNNK